MYCTNNKSLLFGCLILITSYFAVVQSNPVPFNLGNEFDDLLTKTVLNVNGAIGGVVTDTISILQDSVTKALCNLRTDELIKYYGYLAEEHYVITKDGYNLTVFRCNSKKPYKGIKKAVILQHGILSSSDDFCINIPNQALAYVMADANFDVFIPNARGNFYSKRHITLSPHERQFWNFSWYEIGIYDYPAVYNYVIDLTGNKKVYIVGHSQGTSATLAVLSERPEVNNLVQAVSLLAPVSYLNNSAVFYQLVGRLEPLVEPILRDTEFLPRSFIGELSGTICGLGLKGLCDTLLVPLFGQSEVQKNATMYPAFLCHVPSGASFNQMAHFSAELRYGYFGKCKLGSEIPLDFDLSKIRVPISLHFSPNDPFTNPIDVHRLIRQLKSLAFVQKIDGFDHVDFIWSSQAVSLVYSKILAFFKKPIGSYE